MKRIIYPAILILGFASCNPNKIAILDNGYIGMTTDEYGKIFAGSYDLPTSSSKINGKLNPEFTNGRLSSLAISVDNISDFDTAYNVYELGNDLSYKYGAPVENKETIWAGGTSKYFKWKKGLLEVEYSYDYNQVQGTNGLLYTGKAKVVFNKEDSKN
ncbi:MAG: hypothetical protein ABIN89_23330 [Chitinophagaceae bacterium]